MLRNIQRDQYPQTEPAVIGVDVDFTVIFVDCIAETFQSVSVGGGLLLGCDGQPLLEPDIAFVIVLEADDQKVFFRKSVYVDHPFVVVFDLLLAFDGVVQGVSENGADVHYIHKVKQGAVDDIGQVDLVLHAVQGLAGEQGVQHLVAGFVERFITVDVLLELIQILLAQRRVL